MRVAGGHGRLCRILAAGTQDYVSPDGIRVAPALALLKTLI